MLSKNNQIDQGELKLQSFAKPPMVAGTYSLKSKLLVESDDSTGIPKETPNPDVKFTISAPQFDLESALIGSIYPAAGSTAAYAETLPHIVLTRKTLPWERSINADPDNDRPWLYLMLLTEDEVTKEAVSTVKIADVLSNKGLILPKLKPEDIAGKTKEIKVLDIPVSLFKSVVPLYNELSYTVHTRQADTTGKEDNKENSHGWYSVLVANRLPQQDKANHMFLVSLEGHGDLVEDKTDYRTNNRAVRLIVMHHWTFTSAGATFDQLVTSLNNNAQPMGIELKPTLKAGENATILPGVKRAVTYGYTAVNHMRRNGMQSLSWYRGPLVPIKVLKPGLLGYKDADQALRLDEETGMFDISYSVAWQLGRLLALQDPGYSGAISNWQNAYKRDRPVDIAKSILKTELGIEPDKLVPIIQEIEADEVLTDYLIELWKASNSKS